MGLLEADARGAHYPAHHVLQALYDTHHYEEFEQVAVAALSGATWSFNNTQDFQTLRMKAFLAAGKKEQALQAAKVLYNVARFKTTASAIKEIAECLRQAHPNGEQAARDFRLYQFAASRKPRSNATTLPSILPANPLASIAVDGSEFDASYEQVSSDTSAYGLARQGHLLLLMDKPVEAEGILRQAWQQAQGQEKVNAAEDLARAIRAADAGTGRALAFLESLDQPGIAAKP
jgi:hypothetical protein